MRTPPRLIGGIRLRVVGLLISLAALASATGGVLATSMPNTQRSADTPGVADPAAPTNVVSFSLPGEAYDIAADPTSDRLWVAVLRRNDTDKLVAIDTKDGSQQTWAMPDADYGGFVSRIHVGSDGTVWVSQPYRLVRFDPSTQTFASIDFELEVGGDLPNALDPGNPLPGTWISSFDVGPNGVAVARNNVPFITVLQADLKTARSIAVADQFAGAQDVAWAKDGIWVISGPTSERLVARYDDTGREAALVFGGGTRLETNESDVLALGFGDGPRKLGSDTSLLVGASVGTSDESRMAVSGIHVLVYDAAQGTITDFDQSAAVHRYSIEQQNIQVLNPNGVLTDAYIRTRVNDIAVDRLGQVWYLDGNAASIVRIDW